MLVFVEGGKPENPEKNPWSKDKNQQQTQPTYDVESRNRTWATLVGGKCSNHCAIPAPHAPHLVGREDKRANNRIMLPTLKNQHSCRLFGSSEKRAFENCRSASCFFFSCSKIIAHVISDVYQFAHGSVATLWKISCQLLRTGLFNIKRVCYKEDP